MKHFRIEFNQERKKLTVFYNDKPIHGMIGPMAEERFKSLTAEIDKLDVLKQITNGHKAKKAAI